MKVVVLSSGIPSKKYPLNGIFAFDQAKALSQAGIEVLFISIDLRSFRKFRRWGYSCGEREGVRWLNCSIPIGPFPPILRMVEKRLITYLFRKAFVRGDMPDIIHAHFGDMGIVANVLKEKYGIPYVVTEHSSTMNKEVLPYNLITRMKKSYSNAVAVLAVSSLLSKSIKEKTGCNSIVVPNIIDTTVFKLKENSSNKGLRLVTTALLSKRKRVNLVLEAINELKSEFKDIHIDIIGDGAEFEALKKYAEDHFDESLYKFWGLLSREDAGMVYEKADCFVLPSSLETFGVVYVEAMSAGLPVIATRCGGPEDFVDNQNGILIEVDNYQQLKDAIVYMYHNHQNYKPKDIRNSVELKFSPSTISNQIISVYKEVLNK